MKVQVLLLAGAGLGQASWWIFGGGGAAKTETPTEQTAIESQDGPRLGSGDEVPEESSLGVPEIVVSEPATLQSEEATSHVTAPLTEDNPQPSSWSFWPFASSKPAVPNLSVSQFELIDDNNKPIMDVSVHYDDADLYGEADDTGAIAFAEPSFVTCMDPLDSDESPEGEVQREIPAQLLGDEDEFSLETAVETAVQSNEPTYHNRRVKRPAIKTIVLPKTASLETIARSFDALITDSNIARYYFTRMTPLLKKRVKSLAALYNFSILQETTKTITVKRNRMGEFPDYDEVATLLEADELERKAKLSSRAYFHARQSSLVDTKESVPLNKKGPVTVTKPAVEPTPNQKKTTRRQGAKLRARQRKAKLAQQQRSSDEPEIREYKSVESEETPYYSYEPIADYSNDYNNSEENFFDGEYPPEGVYRWDMADDNDYHRYYDGSSGDRNTKSSDSEPEYRPMNNDEDDVPRFESDDYDNDEYDDGHYHSYYDDADYHYETYAQKWKPNAIFNSFI